MCILDLSKVLMYDFHCDYIKNKYGNNSRLLFTDTDTVMYKFKTKIFYEDFSKDKEMLDFSNYSDKSKYYDDSSKLVAGKMKDETFKEIVELKPKTYFFLVDYSIEHKRTKGENENFIATITHNEYKDVLLNNKCLIHLMNRIKSKNHRIRTYETNEYDGLALVIRINYIKKSYLNNYF